MNLDALRLSDVEPEEISRKMRKWELEIRGGSKEAQSVTIPRKGRGS